MSNQVSWNAGTCNNPSSELYQQETLPFRCHRSAKMFALADTESLACHGTSFVSLVAARDYAMSLRELGLCMSFSIGCYKDGKYIEVYKSSAGKDK